MARKKGRKAMKIAPMRGRRISPDRQEILTRAYRRIGANQSNHTFACDDHLWMHLRWHLQRDEDTRTIRRFLEDAILEKLEREGALNPAKYAETTIGSDE